MSCSFGYPALLCPVFKQRTDNSSVISTLENIEFDCCGVCKTRESILISIRLLGEYAALRRGKGRARNPHFYPVTVLFYLYCAWYDMLNIVGFNGMFVCCAGAARQCSKASRTAVSGLHEALFSSNTARNISIPVL